ncbi:hypothetical protein ASPZODRAFT_2123095 [Penicilliopsis zonata CBS 506.65]|uniref:Cytochrome P450 n=1 Tax=Penicilliopsis zonata CBS 506.65 TaxID=1073090 RepID=A0A1L9SLZ5_9EURO|nr:hypothetical protein ASPZODRAFT_2123095 [Penicilliopsis zonata CBS 506.65]OJJ48126.1 hypothetical protein ASPZODRAFT_2123095 [Penicilliopsis zonata CBS 506.65]
MIIAYSIVFSLVVVAGLHALKLRLASLRSLPLPPGPRPKPIVGNVADLPVRGEKGWEHWFKHKDQYGPISSVTTMGQTVIILSKAEVAFELLEKRSSLYSARPEAVFSKELAGWDRTVTMKSSASEVRVHRKYMAHLIGSKKAVANFTLQQDVETRRLLVRLLEHPADLWVHLQRLTAGSMLNILYGYTIEPQGSDSLMDVVNLSLSQFVLAVEPGAWLVDSFPWLKYLPEWFPGAGFHRTAREWGQTLALVAEQPYAFVVHQMGQGNNETSYVSKHIEDLNHKPTPDEEHTIKWTAATMFAGGSDTTPSILSVFFLAMALFPDAQRAAQEELDRVVTTGFATIEDRDRLPYVNALILEAMRWHPVVPLGVPHRSTGMDSYEGYRIPNNSIVVANIWAFTHDPETYPDPMDFKPERFLARNGQAPQLDPTRLIFGFGRRICPGRFLADSTIFLTVSKCLAAFNISKMVKDGQEVEPTVDFTPGTISHPCQYEVSIRPRNAECEALIRSFDDPVAWSSGKGKERERHT